VINAVSPSNDLRLVVAAGGTGGHIFPAVAVVEQIERLTENHCSTVFMGSQDRMETVLIPKLGYPYVSMPIAGFKGLSVSTLTLPLKVFSSIRIARAYIRLHKPHAIVCTGAYISYPVGIAAIREGVPLIVLESNLNPGKTNGRLAPKAAAVVLAFEDSVSFYPESMKSLLHVFGNPVRSQVSAHRDQREARQKLGLHAEKPTVLVFGGSLGARTINIAIERNLSSIATKPYQVLWQTGKGFTTPETLPENVTMVPFLDDMGSAYAAADVVVSRSGATTIAELGIVGKPAILVPLPSASTNEQEHNASVVSRHDAGVVLSDATVRNELLQTIDAIMNNPIRKTLMAQNMSTLGRPKAAEDAANLIIRISGWNNELSR